MRLLPNVLCRVTGACLLLLPLASCRASYVDRGAALYAEHDYVGAAEVFEHNESRSREASERERARYALYRGITLQSLGDVKRAQVWLSQAALLLEHEPDALDSSERLTLTRAIRTNVAFASRAESAGPETVEVTAAR